MFITALYGFNLHVRSDSHALYVEPQAQMLISKMALQHDAAKRYFERAYRQAEVMYKSVDNPDYVNPESTEGEEGSSNQEGSLDENSESQDEGPTTPISDFSNVSLRTVIGIGKDADVNVNTDETFKKFLKLNNLIPAKKAQSRIFCVKNNEEDSHEFFTSSTAGYGECSPESGMDLQCCFGTEEGLNEYGIENGASLYVVTYAPIPIRWQQREENGTPTGLPSKDMVRAMRQFNATNSQFGYFIDRESYDWEEINNNSENETSSEDEEPSEDEEEEQSFSQKYADWRNMSVVDEEGNGVGTIKDIKTDRMTNYEFENFDYFIKGYKVTPMYIPNAIGAELAKECGYGDESKLFNSYKCYKLGGNHEKI